jgi:hypothetical protein
MYSERELDKVNIAEELNALPKDTFQEHVANLDPRYKVLVLAELKGSDEHSPQVMEAWVFLAKQLQGVWTRDPASIGMLGIADVVIKGNFIQRGCTPDELFTNLVNEIHKERVDDNHKEEDLAEIERLRDEVRAAVRGDSAWSKLQPLEERESDVQPYGGGLYEDAEDHEQYEDDANKPFHQPYTGDLHGGGRHIHEAE